MRTRLGISLAAVALAEAAILARAEGEALDVGVGSAGVADRLRERVIAELLRRLLEHQRGLGHLQRRVWILVLPQPFEDVAARDLLAAQIAGLAGGAAQLFELVVIGRELVIGHRS